ncbi:MAG TPA: hypothetical protein VI258_07695 [Rhodanobacteraceae bacterium]
MRGSFYRLASRLHIETRRSVIEKFLLFHQGDVYQPAKLEETERNLRSLAFLKSASVTASVPHNGVVDVLVVTQDAWSIAPQTQAGSGGGTTTYGIDLSEDNLLGYGKNVEVGWSKQIDRTALRFQYNDPALVLPYLRAHADYAITSDGYDRQLNVRRPFFAFDTPWASEAGYVALRQNDHLYRDGIEVSRFRQTHRDMSASYGIALNPNDASANRISVGLRFIDDDFSPVHGWNGVQTSREFRYFTARYEHAENEYLKLNFVNKDLRYEDFDLGRNYVVEAGVSPHPAMTEFVRLRAADGFRLGETSFFMPSVSMRTRVESGIQNAIATANLLYVNRTGEEYPRTFVAHATVASGWRLDPEVQFFADGLDGLRGYRTHVFAGNRALILNFEERFYLGREILQIASPAVVAFFDAGNAGDLVNLKKDVGVGIRMGLPRTPKNLLRIDFAYALNRDPFGRRGWLVSFSSGQAF